MPESLSASPLRALQAFNAVARAGSVVSAAEELAVTPSASSHLVRQLERRLGVVLVTRKGRGLTLTPDGERPKWGWLRNGRANKASSRL